jgi:hypothetical protein
VTGSRGESVRRGREIVEGWTKEGRMGGKAWIEERIEGSGWIVARMETRGEGGRERKKEGSEG